MKYKFIQFFYFNIVYHIDLLLNKTPTDMVCLDDLLDDNDKNILVEVELKLSNFLKHNQ